MNEILNKLLDSLATLLPEVTVPVKLGLIGGIVLLVLFLVCFGLSYAGKIEKYTKLLIEGSKKFASVGAVTDENVDVVYEELKKHPEAVINGWSTFLDQRVGVPSDYFPARDVLSAREFSGKRTLGKSLFVILGTIIWAIVGLIGYYFYGSYPSAPDIDGGSAAGIVLALEFLIIPIGLFIIFYLSLDIVYGKKQKRLGLAYTSFCETLDACVVVTDKEEEAFVSDNLAEINKRVEELVAGRLDDEIIEVVTVPRQVDVGDVSVSDVLKSLGIDKEPEPAPVEPVVEEKKEPSPEELEREAFVASALENKDFVRYALENEKEIQEWLEHKDDEPEPMPEPAPEPEPEAPAPPDFSQMTEEESYDWVEMVLQVCEQALQDKNTDPEDLNTMGMLLDQTLAVLDEPTCVAAITDYLGKLADKYFSIVEG